MFTIRKSFYNNLMSDKLREYIKSTTDHSIKRIVENRKKLMITNCLQNKYENENKGNIQLVLYEDAPNKNPLFILFLSLSLYYLYSYWNFRKY